MTDRSLPVWVGAGLILLDALRGAAQERREPESV